MAPLNIAIIGCGRQGQTLIACLLAEALPEVRIQALCDIWPRNLARTQRLLADHAKLDLTGHTYEDFRQMLEREKDLHAAIIATPDGAHAEQTVACFRAGLHVYCEAPISNDLQQARQMVLAARETGKQLQIGHQRRSNPYYRQAYRLLHETNLLGQLTSAQCESNASVAESRFIEVPAAEAPDLKTLERYGYASAKEFLNWRWFRKHGGGPFLSEGSHSIDTVSWMLDRAPTSAVFSGGRDYWRDREAYDQVVTVLEFGTPVGPLRLVIRYPNPRAMSQCSLLISGINGSICLSDEPGDSFALPEGWLPVDGYGEHPWFEAVKKGYGEPLRRSTLIIDTSKIKTKDESTRDKSKENGMADLIRFYRSHPYRSPNRVLDAVLLATPSPWEIPSLFFSFVLTPNTRGTFGNMAPPKSPFGPHLANFVDAIRGTAMLFCPADAGYRSAAVALQTLQTLEAGRHEVGFQPTEIE